VASTAFEKGFDFSQKRETTKGLHDQISKVEDFFVPGGSAVIGYSADIYALRISRRVTLFESRYNDHVAQWQIPNSPAEILWGWEDSVSIGSNDSGRPTENDVETGDTNSGPAAEAR
jgi:hypothetical protein